MSRVARTHAAEPAWTNDRVLDGARALHQPGHRPPPRARRADQSGRPVRAREPRGVRRWLGRGRGAEAVRDHRAYRARGRIITRNESPDIGFDRSINAYRGCEHGCSYCFARPTHAYLGHSAGLDFERDIYVKVERGRAAAARARRQALQAQADRHGHQHRPLPAGRAQAQADARHPRGAARNAASGRRSSPSRRWWCATSTS